MKRGKAKATSRKKKPATADKIEKVLKRARQRERHEAAAEVLEAVWLACPHCGKLVTVSVDVTTRLE